MPTPQERQIFDALCAGQDYDARDDAERGQGSKFVPPAARNITISGTFLTQLIREHAHELPRGINIRGVRIDGEVQIENVQIDKAVWLENCYITGPIVARNCKVLSFSLSGSVLESYLDMRSSVVSGGVFLRDGFIGRTSTLLRGTAVTGSIDCSDATFEYNGANLDHDPELKAEVDGESCSLARCKAAALFWRKMRKRPEGIVNLRNCHFDSLRDDDVNTAAAVVQNWPSAGMLRMIGLKYDQRSSTDPDALLAWIALQDPTENQFGTYQTAIKLLTDTGQELSANELIVAKQRYVAQHERSFLNRWLRWAYIVLSEAGIGTTRALIFTVAAFFLSWAIIMGANCAGAFIPKSTDITKNPCFPIPDPTKVPDCKDWKPYHGFNSPPYYPGFSSFGYTVDLFVPGISYSVAADWRPRPENTLMIIVTILIRAAGVVLTGLLVVCVTGIARYAR